MSRDQNSFLPVTPQRSILLYVMWGDSEPASKNTYNDVSFIPSGPFHKFKKKLG